jgi:hypothetical protein
MRFSTINLASCISFILCTFVTAQYEFQFEATTTGNERKIGALEGQFNSLHPSTITGSGNGSNSSRIKELQDQYRRQYPSATIGIYRAHGSTNDDDASDIRELENAINWQIMNRKNRQVAEANPTTSEGRVYSSYSQQSSLGSNGQFNYAAASGSTGPSAIDAINSSLMRNAAEARVMEAANDRSWRARNAKAVYDGLNKLDPDDDQFLNIYNGLDPRARKLPGVTAKLHELKSIYDKRKGLENAQWDTLINDARKHGTAEEAKYLSDLRMGGGTLAAAMDNAYGEKGFMTRFQANKDALAEAQALAAQEALYAKEEAKVNADYERVTKVLTRRNKRFLDQRENLYKRQAKIKDMQNAAVNDIEPNKARDQRLKAGLDNITEELGELNKKLKSYDDGMAAAEAELDNYYNSQTR